MTREHAILLRRLIEKSASSLTDTDALQGIELFPKWTATPPMTYEVGDRVSYNGTLFKCLTAHTSQASWTPTDSPSLWVRVDDPTIEFPDWHQPTGAHDAYAKGDKVSHLGKHWISTVDGNVWEPSVYGWDEV